MKKYLIAFTFLLSIVNIYSAQLEARGRGGAIAGGFIAGALLGSALSHHDYYYDRPYYDYYYPGAPRYAYDYPAYVYSPVYAYPTTRYSVYPSYYLIP